MAYFGASWCTACKAITPLFRELAKTQLVPAQPAVCSPKMNIGNTTSTIIVTERSGCKIAYFTVDVDDNQELAAHYDVSALPAFFVIRGSVVVDRWVGAKEDVLKATVSRNLPTENLLEDTGACVASGEG